MPCICEPHQFHLVSTESWIKYLAGSPPIVVSGLYDTEDIVAATSFTQHQQTQCGLHIYKYEIQSCIIISFTDAIHISTSPSPYRQTYNIYLSIGEGAEMLHQDFFQNGEVRDKHSR